MRRRPAQRPPVSQGQRPVAAHARGEGGQDGSLLAPHRHAAFARLEHPAAPAHLGHGAPVALQAQRAEDRGPGVDLDRRLRPFDGPPGKRPVADLV